MTAKEILAEIKPLGAEGYRKILAKHGVTQTAYGVKVEYLKKIKKRIKTDHQLALDLFETKVYDAMYLAGMLVDDKKMSKKDLNHWLDLAGSGPICGCTVAAVAAESNHGYDVALEWIDSKNSATAATGWSTLVSVVGIKNDADLNLPELKKLLQRIQKTINTEPDRVRYAMNLFVISVATYVKPLTKFAIQTAEKIGKVSVDMGDTDCKVPFAPDYIKKCIDHNPTGKKRKTAKC